MRRLFLDLDGVMADFDGDFERRVGISPADYCAMQGDDAMWTLINSWDRFFRNLPACPGALNFYDSLATLGILPIILTACPRSDYENVATQKRQWVREWLGRDVLVLPTCGGSTKPRFMQHPGDILIDDFERNTKAWEKAGGIAILHEGDWTETMGLLRAAMR